MLLNVRAHKQHFSYRINLFRAAHFPCDELISPYRTAQSQYSASWSLLYSDGVTFKPIFNFFSFFFFFLRCHKLPCLFICRQINVMSSNNNIKCYAFFLRGHKQTCVIQTGI